MYKNQHKNFLNRRGKTENYRIFHSFNNWSQLLALSKLCFFIFYEVPVVLRIETSKQKLYIT